jgi:DNA ligase-associated metallophosphoesterase
VRWAGEDLLALADRALYWPRRQTLCIADVHLGKAAAFRAAGIPVPEHATTKDLARLSAIIETHQPRRLVILGDLIHARSGRAPGTLAAVCAWRARHPELDVLLVRGNHDHAAGDPPADWRIRVLSGPCAEPDDGGMAFAHDPAERDGQTAMRDRFILCGHLHPAIAIGDAARSIRPRCFCFGHASRVAILPAFGSFTGSRRIEPKRGDQILAIEDGAEIIDVSRCCV